VFLVCRIFSRTGYIQTLETPLKTDRRDAVFFAEDEGRFVLVEVSQRKIQSRTRQIDQVQTPGLIHVEAMKVLGLETEIRQ
jgi:hypothetical protein